MVPVTTTASPARAPLRLTMVPLGTVPSAVIEIGDRAGRAHRIAAQERTVIAVGIRTEPAREQIEPGVGHRLRQRERQQKACGFRALGGEVGEIHPQRLLRHHVGGVSAKKCTPPTMASAVSTSSWPAARLKRGGVVRQIEGAGVLHNRPEKLGDQAIFRELVR